MDLVRKLFDQGFDLAKPLVFHATKRDPEHAHTLFVRMAQVLQESGTARFVLDNHANHIALPVELSNAAGFNKNGDIPPQVLKYMGFDRVVVGTVTKDVWQGNSRPRCVRYTRTESLVNWMGLPGIGASAVAKQLHSYGLHRVPLTINLMSTPGKQGDHLLEDLQATVVALRDVPYVDRFELNISCPNTHGSGGNMDARREYQSNLDAMLKTVSDNLLFRHHLWLKVSPDLDEHGVKEIVDVAQGYKVIGYTTTNTTTKHDPEYISPSPGKGGGSGNAVYADSFRVQQLFQNHSNASYIACGGINSIERVHERTRDPATIGIQMYTPVIFGGPRFLRKLRQNAKE